MGVRLGARRTRRDGRRAHLLRLAAEPARPLSPGIRSLGTGLALFVAFGLFFEGIIGLSGEPFLIGSDFLPIVLIGLGVILVGWGLIRGRQRA